MAIDENELRVKLTGDDTLTPTLTQLESKIIRFVGAVSSALTAIQVISFPVTAVRNFEKELANVQKTTNFTNSELQTLGNGLVDLSRKINVSAADLAKIAAAAGQQGLGRFGVEGVRKFTETVSRMASVLDISAEDAATNVGKIASIFQVSMNDIERVSSAFNQASNNSTASGEQLLDVVKRIGDASGSISLKQSVGLAASAIDFGVSPEVAGTSISKIFSEFYARADKFSKLLGINVNEWLQALNKDGIQAFKMYLDALRTMAPDAQQSIIKQLSGGGRISSLLTKFVRDTSNVVLDKNIDQASEGWVRGTSAIKEQATVLKTLDAEIDKAGNSLQALGIKAGEVFGVQLAEYVRQLNDALADPAVINFAKQVGRAFLDLFDGIAATIKYVSQLNVNFENLVTIVKWFVAFKGIQLVGAGALGQISKATQSMALLRAAASGDTAATAAAGATGATAGIAGMVANWKALTASIREASAASKERAALEAQLEAQNIALIEAETTAYQAGQRVREAAEARTAAGAAITAARNNIVAAEAAAQQRMLQVREQYAARIQAAAAAQAERLALIDAEYQAKRQSANAMGSRRLLNQAKADRDAQLAEEEAYMARSLRGIETYWARRIAAAEAASQAEITAARRGLAGATTQFDTLVANQNNPGRDASLANAQGAVVVASGNVDKTNEALAQNAERAEAAAKSSSKFMNVVRALGGALTFLFGIISRGFFWLSLLYLALDAFGVLDKLGPMFNNFAKALGLSSEAARKEAEHQRELAAAYMEANRKREDAIKSLEKYVDATSQLKPSVVESLTQNLTDSDAGTRDAAQAQLIDIMTKNQEAIDQNKLASDAFQPQKEAIQKQVDELKATLVKAQEEVAAAQKAYNDALNDPTLDESSGANLVILDNQKAAAEKTLQDTQDALDKSLNQLQSYSDSVQAQLANEASNLADNSAKLDDIVAGMLTETSAKVFEAYAQPYLDALEAQKKYQEESEAAQKKVQSLSAAAESDPTTENLQALAQATQDAKAAIDALGNSNRDLDAFRAGIQQIINNLTQMGKPEDIPLIGSLQWILKLLESGAAGVANVQGSLLRLRTNNTPLTGPLAKPEAQGQGTGTFNVQSESEARRAMRARIELAKAQLQAETNLQKEMNSEREDELNHSYSRSLVTIKDYYAQRLALAQSNLDLEIKLQQQTIDAIQQEMGASGESVKAQINAAQEALAGATDKNRAQLEANLKSAQSMAGSEQIRMQAQVVAAQGQMAVLQKKRADLVRSNANDMSDAVRQFEDSMAQQRQSIVSYLGSDTDLDAFSAALDAAQAEYRDTIQKMRTEAADHPELLPAIKAAELIPGLKALEAALDDINKKADLTGRQFDNMSSRIQAATDAGTISRLQAAAAQNDLRKQEINYQETLISGIEKSIDKYKEQNGAIAEQTDKYKELVQQLDDAKTKLVELQAKGDETAKDINEGIRGAFEDLFNSIASADTDNLAENFIKSLTASISSKASEGLADSIMNALGSGGDGGIGGFFSGLFGADTQKKPTGTMMDPIYVKMTDGVPGVGGSDMNSVWSNFFGADNTSLGVTDVTGQSDTASAGKDMADAFIDQLGGGAEGGGAGDGITAGLTDTFSQWFGDGGSISNILGSLGSGIGGVVSAVQSGFGGLTGFLFSMLPQILTAIFSSGSSSQGSGFAAMFSSAGSAPAAHTGGIAGHFTMRRSGIPFAAFADAIRYHTGGIAGLKSDEVPAVLRKGEEILTQQDPRHRDNLGSGSDSGGTAPQDQFVVQPVLSESTILEAMKSSAGRKLLIVHISKSPTEFRQALGLNR